MDVKALLSAVLAVAGSAALGVGHGLWIARTVSAGGPSPVASAPTQQASGERTSGRVRELKPIVVNLAAPPNAWLRLEAAVVFESNALPEADAVVAELSNDYLALLRTMSAQQIEGADGLQLLREELEERAATRSRNAIREVTIQTLVVQ